VKITSSVLNRVFIFGLKTEYIKLKNKKGEQRKWNRFAGTYPRTCSTAIATMDKHY
jgi:hypothetical protein